MGGGGPYDSTSSLLYWQRRRGREGGGVTARQGKGGKIVFLLLRPIEVVSLPTQSTVVQFLWHPPTKMND